MKRIAFWCLVLACICAGCKNKDYPVAEYNHHKLYLSEIQSFLPKDLSADDSIAFVQQVVNDWITEQIVLEEAEKKLSFRDRIFDSQLADYRKTLLKQRYYDWLTSDARKFAVADEEVRREMARGLQEPSVAREIVQLNYVKVSSKSAQYASLKEILFDENRRTSQKEELEKLCADSLEYFIEDGKWLFLSDIQKDIPLQLQGVNANAFPLHLEKRVNDACYLIVVLNYKEQQTGEESKDYFESVRTMLIQQKKQAFIQHKIDSLTSEHKNNF